MNARPITVPLKRYFKGRAQRDIMAGLTVGVVSLPLGMAFAIASGVKPEYGIYTTIIAGILAALFGGSKYQVTGPTGAFIPILLSIVLTYGYENLLLAGALAGIILILMGVFQMGTLIKFIPRPVTIGFTAGIAVNIFTGQIANVLGLTGLERHESFISNMRELALHLGGANLYSILTAVICLTVILITPRLMPRVPGALVGLILSAVAAAIFYPGQVATVASTYGGIPGNLPGFHMPEITWEKLQLLARPAFTIAMLGAIESLLSAVVADGMTGLRHNSNRELIGQGIANVVTPFFGGIPATGAIARTATNIKTGAVTRNASIIAALFVLATLLVLAPYAGHIPLSSMAPVLMIVAYNMSEYHSFFSILKIRSNSAVVLIITFLLTVLADLTLAVEVGLLLAMVIFVKRMSDVLVVAKVLPDPENNYEPVSTQELLDTHDCPQISIYSVEGPLFFGAAQMFSQSILDTIHYEPKILILRMSKVPFMDITGEDHLRTIIGRLQKRGTIVLISGLNPQPEKILKKTDLYDTIGEANFFPHTIDAITYAVRQIDKEQCRNCKKRIFQKCLASEETVKVEK